MKAPVSQLQSQGNGIAFYNYLTPYTPPELLYNISTYGGAFLTGSQANTAASNATHCLARALNVWFFELPQIQWYYYYGSFEDNLFNTTLEIANVTNALMVCYDALENLSETAVSHYSAFSTFADFLMAFIQNVLGNITTLMNIYKNIEAATLTGDYITISTQIGKIVYILLNVQPIEFAARPEPMRAQQIPINLEAPSSANTTTYGYEEVMTFSGFISFTTGAIAGTRMTTSNNLTLCQNNLLTEWA